jgi:hypothetical protein
VSGQLLEADWLVDRGLRWPCGPLGAGGVVHVWSGIR